MPKMPPRSQGLSLAWERGEARENSIQTAVIQTTLIKMHANLRF